VLVEAGYRCAIPVCQQHPVDVHHINEWSSGGEHTFGNLIALCANCHRRVTSSEIDRQAVQHYKDNLAVLNGRYGLLEQRLLRELGELERDSPSHKPVGIISAWGLELVFQGITRDGLVVDRAAGEPGLQIGLPTKSLWELTDRGREFIGHWFDAQPLDPA
jgi:hypothetical protein